MAELLAELRARFCEQFCDVARARLGQLRAVAAAGEVHEARRELHALAGEAAMLGFDAVRDAARAAEQRCERDELDPDRLLQVIEHLSSLIDGLTPAATDVKQP